MNKIEKKFIENLEKQIVSESNFLKEVKKNIYLRKNEIEILDNNNIDYTKCKNLSEIIYLIEKKLDEDFKEELEFLSSELSERNYYQNTKK